MKRKVIIILALIYSVQLVISCCPEETLENTINGVTSRTLKLDTNGFSFVEVNDQQTINKEELIIEILLEGTQIQVSDMMNEMSKLGLSSAYASIDCADATILYKNNVEAVEVIAIDVNSIETDVTNNLVIHGSNQSIADYISTNVLSVFDGFIVEFNDVTNLSSQAEFRIRVLLDDNTVVETTTNQINFN